MIKVIEFVGSLKDGGAETLVKDYVSLIDKKKFDVKILTIYPMKNTANYCQAAKMGVSVLSIYSSYNMAVRVVNKLFGKWYVPLRLKQILKRENPDCIHIHSQIAWAIAKIRRVLGHTKLIYTCHSDPNQYFSKVKHSEEAAVSKLICENNLRLIALHEDMRKELNRRFAVENTIVVNNGVRFSQYRKVEWESDKIRASIGIPRNAFVTVHVGRFAAVKNHNFLLDVFSEIKKQRENAHLLLIGDGPLKANICEKIKRLSLDGCVTMLSHRTDVPQLLYASDLVIFPSQYEGLSVALVEAQVTGLRCLVSDSVNQANFLTENTIPVSLQYSARQWADIALDENVKNADYGDLQQFDLGKEIRKLELIYSQSVLSEA